MPRPMESNAPGSRPSSIDRVTTSTRSGRRGRERALDDVASASASAAISAPAAGSAGAARSLRPCVARWLCCPPCPDTDSGARPEARRACFASSMWRGSTRPSPDARSIAAIAAAAESSAARRTRGGVGCWAATAPFAPDPGAAPFGGERGRAPVLVPGALDGPAGPAFLVAIPRRAVARTLASGGPPRCAAQVARASAARARLAIADAAKQRF
mmetsp:Transcript_8400/g.33152  ORF Transcript_8400/g.33152 Transcript_8400/m.33152 type:complete len:214 (-) Transcript_8400:533-1174(-)